MRVALNLSEPGTTWARPEPPMRRVHLTDHDLDMMAIAIHREDDPDFDQHSFAAYAPDPDRDYQRGHDAGFHEGYLAAINEARMVRWGAPRLTRLDALIIGLALAIVTAVLLAGATG